MLANLAILTSEYCMNVLLQTTFFQSAAMVTFFEVIRYKLSCTLASLEGNPSPTHPLADKIEHHTDKQVSSLIEVQIRDMVNPSEKL